MTTQSERPEPGARIVRAGAGPAVAPLTVDRDEWRPDHDTLAAAVGDRTVGDELADLARLRQTSLV